MPAEKPAKLPETTEGLPWHSNHEIKKEPNAFIQADLYNRTYAWAGMAVRLVIVFGSLFSVYQFLAARSEKRVERTLGLVELWDAAEYQAAQAGINKRLAELNAENAQYYPSNPTPAQAAEYFSRIGIQAMKPIDTDPSTAAMPDHFEKIVYFLNRMAFCVEGNLCSDDVADAYFKDYAVSFWQYFAGYVGERRKSGSPSFAQPIETYVRSRATEGPSG